MIFALPWIPLLAAFFLLFIPANRTQTLKQIALAACAVPFLIVLYLISQFKTGTADFQFVEKIEWMPALGISYQAGVDGISIVLCLLHAIVSLAGVLISNRVTERIKEYLFFYLILAGSIYGVFTTLDLFVIYLFYELTLIPLYPMIGIWGSKNKEYGAMKLTIFITTGAVCGLFGMLLLYEKAGLQSFDLIYLTQTLRTQPFEESFQRFLSPFLLLGFGVIASLVPLHSWSPIGYAVAPTSVSMLHAGVLKKMGPYLMLRFALGLLPAGVHYWSPYLAALGAAGILYAGYAAIRQKDLKYMVGFSSVSHMGYVMLGLAAMNSTALSGMVLLMFSHGVMAACTFALIGFIYDQAHTRGIQDFGGLAKKIPFISICYILACLASAGVPGFSNFASEILIFIGSWRQYPVPVGAAVFGVLITAIYLFRSVQSIFFGPFNPRWNQLKDAVSLEEKLPFILMLGALILFGFWPHGLLHLMQASIDAIAQPAVSFSGVTP